MIHVLVSACLLGERVRYHGGDAACASSILSRWIEEGRVVSFCPEVAGGLPVPRPPAEIQGGDGDAVLDLRARVRTREGSDVTEEFLAGARGAVEMSRELEVGLAVLVDGSPSCGSGEIHDGGFAGRTVPGQGVTTALLERCGIRVFSERELAEAELYLASLESSVEDA